MQFCPRTFCIFTHAQWWLFTSSTPDNLISTFIYSLLLSWLVDSALITCKAANKPSRFLASSGSFLKLVRNIFKLELTENIPNQDKVELPGHKFQDDSHVHIRVVLTIPSERYRAYRLHRYPMFFQYIWFYNRLKYRHNAKVDSTPRRVRS